MTNNQHNRLDNDIVKFKETMLTQYGIEIIVFQKLHNEGEYRPTLQQIHKACITVMHMLYPELQNINKLSELNRTKDLVMFRKIYCHICHSMRYTCHAVGKYIKRDHSSVVHSRNSVDDMLYIKDKSYMNAFDKINKLINTYVGIIPNNIQKQT